MNYPVVPEGWLEPPVPSDDVRPDPFDAAVAALNEWNRQSVEAHAAHMAEVDALIRGLSVISDGEGK